MKLGDVWFSAIAEAENSDRMIVVSGRTEIEPFIQSGKFKERVEITWKYEADSKGMPNETTGKLMEEVQTVLKQAMEKDKLAIFTGIYTGDGERTWVFYTRNIPALLFFKGGQVVDKQVGAAPKSVLAGKLDAQM